MSHKKLYLNFYFHTKFEDPTITGDNDTPTLQFHTIRMSA